MRLRNAAPLLIFSITLQSLALPGAIAATPSAKAKSRTTTVKKITTAKKSIPKKATPKKTVAKKASIKKTVAKKAIAKKSLVKKKLVAKKTVTGKKKSVATKKKVVARTYVHRSPVHKAVQPSPSPKWPPKGFISVGTAYARVPTGSELIGIFSAMKNSSTASDSCSADPANPNKPAFSCAAILVGSSQRCTWWKVSSTITGIDPANPQGRISLGDFISIVSGASAKTIQTIILVSPVPLATGVKFTAVRALCGIGASSDPIPSTSFGPTSTPTPSTSPTPSDSPSPAETPTPTNT